jgi:hypothetical protein
MNQRLTRTAAFFAILLGALVLAGCGGGAPAPSDATAVDPQVKPLTGAEAEGDMTVKLADGTAPCGVFNVNGFGNKKAVLADFPACTAAAYQVQCLDDKAQWQPTYISNVALSGDKTTVHFTSAQEGTCALFPAK